MLKGLKLSYKKRDGKEDEKKEAPGTRDDDADKLLLDPLKKRPPAIGHNGGKTADEDNEDPRPIGQTKEVKEATFRKQYDFSKIDDGNTELDGLGGLTGLTGPNGLTGGLSEPLAEQQKVLVPEDLLGAANAVWDLIKNKQLVQASDTNERLSNDAFRLLRAPNPLGAPGPGAETGAVLVDGRPQPLVQVRAADPKKLHVLGKCRFCLANGLLKEYEILDANEHLFILQPNKTPFAGKHFLIVPVSHCVSMLESTETEYLQLQVSKKEIRRQVRAHGEDVLFIETSYRHLLQHHTMVDVLIGPSDSLEQAPIFFGKAFDDGGGEWRTNRRQVLLHKAGNGSLYVGLKKSIPVNLPYVHVEWSEDEGVVHLIENEETYDRSTVYDVFGSMIDIDPLEAKQVKELLPQQMIQFKKTCFVKTFLKDVK